jgi:hypothetical protein
VQGAAQPVKKRKQMTLFETPFQIRRSRCSIEGELIHNFHNHKTVKLQEAELSLTTEVLQPQVEGGGCNLGQGALRALKSLSGTTRIRRRISLNFLLTL